MLISGRILNKRNGTKQARPFCRCAALILVLMAIAGSVPWAEAGTIRYVSSSGGDDRAAINNMISISAPGDTVYLNAGTFQISNAIQAKTGVSIVGAGEASTTVRYTGVSGNPMVSLGGSNHAEVANLTLDGNGNAAQGVINSAGSYQYVHDTAIQNLAANGIGVDFWSSVTDSRIVNNQFSNIGVGSAWGAGIRMSWGSSRNQVLNNTITNAGLGGIFANDGCTDLVIKNNTVTGSGSGGTGMGIEVWKDCDRALIQNNTIDQWLSVDTASQVAVRNNVINGGWAGLEFARGGHDNVFSNNTVNADTQIGISVSNTGLKARFLWAHNTISGAKTCGAQIQDDGGGIQKMYFYKNTFQGTTGVGALYEGQGEAFRFNPIHPSGSIHNITLDSNTITTNHYTGIQCGDGTPNPSVDKLSVINNTITGNGGPAFTGDFWSSGEFFGNDLRWEGNVVSGNGNNSQPPSEGTFFAPNSRPSVSINTPSAAIVGQPVQFSLNYAPGADPLGDVLWDLGDGLPATTSSTSFTYLNPGVYTVDLAVWDTSGRAAFDEVSLTVSVPEPSTLAMLLVAGMTGRFYLSRQRRK